MDKLMQNEPDYKEIGVRLREVRGALSQTSFGNSIGYSYSYVKSCEHGKKQSLEYLFKVSDVYNVSLEWLLKGTASIDAKAQKIEVIPDPDLKRMIDILKGIMEDPNPRRRAWGIMQFEDAFKQYCVTYDEKKIHA